MKVAVIGGYGKMGLWFARWLLNQGKQVVISGRDHRKVHEAAKQIGAEAADSQSAVKHSDAVIISVPIDRFEDVVREIAGCTSPGQMIFDVTSVKAMPMEVMHRYIKNGTILGVHPMFGPGADGISGQRFVLTPTTPDEEKLADNTRKYLEEKGARVAVMPPAEHDELMAVVLGLSHFVALAAGDTLASLGRLKQMRQISGTTFKVLLMLAESVASEDADFYSALQMNLPGLENIERRFADTAGKWLELVEKKDGAGFAQKMKGLKKRLSEEDPDFEKAYKDMYRLLKQ